MKEAKGIKIPIDANMVLSPDVYYSRGGTRGTQVGIYFITAGGTHGRITFDKLDALKVCRGEELPYDYSWDEYAWVFKVQDSDWLAERFAYECAHYGHAYEFGGSVEEMMSDFGHYVFKFHDEFVEVIARGFWYEEDEESLFEKPLQPGHPLLDLPEENIEKFIAHSITCQIRKNRKSHQELINDARICPQKVLQFALELDGKATPDLRLTTMYRNGQLKSILSSEWGNEMAQFEDIANLKEIKPYVDEYMQKVHEYRKRLGK